MKSLVRSFVLVAALGLTLTGCRFKSWESFDSATTPNPTGPAKGDIYSGAGGAAASGGLNTDTSYGKGAAVASTSKIEGSMDQPAKGSGQLSGENSGNSVDGFGNSNGAAQQNSPSAVGADLNSSRGN